MGMNHFPVDLPRLVDFYLSAVMLDLDTIIAERISLDQINEGFDTDARADIQRAVGYRV